MLEVSTQYSKLKYVVETEEAFELHYIYLKYWKL